MLQATLSAPATSAPIDLLNGMQSLWGTVNRRPPARAAQPAPIADPGVWSPSSFGLTKLWREVQDLPAHEVDAGLTLLLQRLCELLSADGVRWQLLGSPRPGKSMCVSERCVGQLPDPQQPPPGNSWEQAGHELAMTLPVRPGLRMHFMLARSAGQGAFTDADRATLDLALTGMARWLNWLALSHGPAASTDPLPPHQRKVLLLLLTGLSEKQIASELNLSTNTAHQYVTALYRRFKVRNRPSLTAQWLSASM
ncbi:MAG: hypothetical protein EOP40_03560 [Rubrivivax sp.]|nr:MAG: hypothetical protein EOP40_03560 [Rubrivivax sp.]